MRRCITYDVTTTLPPFLLSALVVPLCPNSPTAAALVRSLPLHQVAHQSSLASREEELEMYYKLLAETREAFYEGIQELRAYLEVEG